MTVYAITTKDNPFNPFDDFDKWFAYDHSKGYFTAEWLARLAGPSPKLSLKDNQKEIEDAIDDIISVDPNFYVKVSKEIETKEI